MAEVLGAQVPPSRPAKTEADIARRKAELDAQLEALKKRRKADDDEPPHKPRE